jgi:nitroreductase
MGQAPLAVVASASPSPFGESGVRRAIQDMMLVAWSHGVGSNWTGFHGLEALHPVMGLPDDEDIIAIVPFGYPAQRVGAGIKKRQPLGEVVFRERFGWPFAECGMGGAR